MHSSEGMKIQVPPSDANYLNQSNSVVVNLDEKVYHDLETKVHSLTLK